MIKTDGFDPFSFGTFAVLSYCSLCGFRVTKFFCRLRVFKFFCWIPCNSEALCWFRQHLFSLFSVFHFFFLFPFIILFCFVVVVICSPRTFCSCQSSIFLSFPHSPTQLARIIHHLRQIHGDLLPLDNNTVDELTWQRVSLQASTAYVVSLLLHLLVASFGLEVCRFIKKFWTQIVPVLISKLGLWLHTRCVLFCLYWTLISP